MSKRRWFTVVLLLSAALASPSAQAESGEREDIVITSNKHFDKAHGVRSGRGTPSDPYVISLWQVRNITILNTTKAVRITNNLIGSLTLNYAGRHFTVRDNDIGDLRVNENVPRTGAPTSGSFTQNTIGVVSQIRHFDGHFAYNTVGSEPGLLSLGTPLAVNFDGFNGAMFHHNTIYGLVDVRLHGHHHSSGFGDSSHMHSGHHEHDMVDHTKRYHEVTVAKNTIYSNGSYALAYIDTNHAANDRTANSETNEELELPHVHRTSATFRDNRLVGAGILVDAFNAEDSLHKKFWTGTLSITGNRISLADDGIPFSSSSGIQIGQARNLVLRIASNTVSAPPPDPAHGPAARWFAQFSGVSMSGMNVAKITIENLRVTNTQYGVYATEMTSSVHWTITRLRTSGVADPVAYDSSVANKPRVG